MIDTVRWIEKLWNKHRWGNIYTKLSSRATDEKKKLFKEQFADLHTVKKKRKKKSENDEKNVKSRIMSSPPIFLRAFSIAFILKLLWKYYCDRTMHATFHSLSSSQFLPYCVLLFSCLLFCCVFLFSFFRVHTSFELNSRLISQSQSGLSCLHHVN